MSQPGHFVKTIYNKKMMPQQHHFLLYPDIGSILFILKFIHRVKITSFNHIVQFIDKLMIITL